MKITWKTIAPLVIWLVIYLVPVPAGLNADQWHYFAIFAAVIAGLILESMPVGAVGLIGLTVAGVMGYVEHDPNKSLRWMLGGFSESTVWLIVGAFVFSIGYRKSGLGRRLALMLVHGLGRRTIGLGYAVAFSDLVLAPATPSNTARSRRHHLPDRQQHPAHLWLRTRAHRRQDRHLCDVDGVRDHRRHQFAVSDRAGAERGGALDRQEDRQCRGRLVAMVHRLRAARNPVADAGAAAWLRRVPARGEGEPGNRHLERERTCRDGPAVAQRMDHGSLVLLAMFLWICGSNPTISLPLLGSNFINPTMVVFVVISLMLLTGVIDFDDIVRERAAWEVFFYFTSLLTLSSGLNEIGFIKWVAEGYAKPLASVSPMVGMILLVSFFFWVHYFFSSITSHAAAVLPVVLAVGTSIPGLSVPTLTLLCVYSLGLMGVISPYATGPAPMYFGSGYIGKGDFWKFGLIFGVIYFAGLLVIVLPWLQLIG